jgi:threonyl-tRNA synthetase
VPYVLVAGDKEIEAGSVSVRDRAGVEKRGVPFEAFLQRAITENESRALETGDLEELG